MHTLTFSSVKTIGKLTVLLLRTTLVRYMPLARRSLLFPVTSNCIHPWLPSNTLLLMSPLGHPGRHGLPHIPCHSTLQQLVANLSPLLSPPLYFLRVIHSHNLLCQLSCPCWIHFLSSLPVFFYWIILTDSITSYPCSPLLPSHPHSPPSPSHPPHPCSFLIMS